MLAMRADNVVLVGFMGAGKSSVGRLLARRLGRCFVETDDMIIAREGCSIPESFARHGEAHFRAAQEEAARPRVGGRPRDEVEALCRSREPFYRQADLSVDTTGLGPDQVVSRILGALAARAQAAR